MKKRIVIIGGGISGLAAAHRLSELAREQSLPLEICVVEARPRLGGVLETECRAGLLLEGGADSFITDKPWAVELCRRLGLEGELIPTREEDRRSFVVRHGRLEPVPAGFHLITAPDVRTVLGSRLLSWPGKLRMACEMFIPPRMSRADQSAADFVRRRFGAEALERIGQPMIGGIYTADPKQLSLKATFPKFLQMERRFGSVTAGLRHQAKLKNKALREASGPRYGLFLSLRGGMEVLIQSLVRSMPEVHFKTSAPVRQVLREEKKWKVLLEGGEMEADALCLAVPAWQAACLLAGPVPDLAELLDSIPYESAMTVNLAYPRAVVRHPLNGFGFVVPAVENYNLIGCTFSSQKFQDRSPQDTVLLRAFAGGAFQRKLFVLSDQEIEALVRKDLEDLLGIQAGPLHVSVKRYEKAMPQYRVGHLEKVAQIEQEVKKSEGLFLTGNAYRGVSIPDCIRQAEEAAQRMVQSLQAGKPVGAL